MNNSDNFQLKLLKELWTESVERALNFESLEPYSAERALEIPIWNLNHCESQFLAESVKRAADTAIASQGSSNGVARRVSVIVIEIC